MSTYTDLKNVVKETVEVNYAANDRSTNQKVKFLNEENVFWGTLHGKIGDDVKINDTTLSGATITKSKLKDVQLDGVTLDNCQSLIDLSATDVVLDTKIDASLAEAKYDIGLVDQSLKNVSADLQYKIDHIDKDYHIVSAYSTLLTELSTKEIADVANLQGQINKTAQDIIACGLQERQDFALLSAANISTVEQLSIELKGDIAANKVLIDEISGKINDSSAAISFLSNDISVRLNEVDDRRAVGDFNLRLDLGNLSIEVDRKLSNIEALSDLNKVISAFNDLSTFTISSIDGISCEVSSAISTMISAIAEISGMTSGFDARLDLNDAAIHALNVHHDVDMVNTHHALSAAFRKINEISSQISGGGGASSEKLNELSVKFEGVATIVSDISGKVDDIAQIRTDLNTLSTTAETSCAAVSTQVGIDLTTLEGKAATSCYNVSSQVSIDLTALEGKAAVSCYNVSSETTTKITTLETNAATSCYNVSAAASSQLTTLEGKAGLSCSNISTQVGIDLTTLEDKAAASCYNVSTQVGIDLTTLECKAATSCYNVSSQVTLDISGLESRASVSCNNLSLEINPKLAAITTSCDTLNANVAGIDGRVTTNTNDITSARTAIENLTSGLNTLEGKAGLSCYNVSSEANAQLIALEGRATTSCYNISASAETQFTSMNADIQSVKRSLIGSVEYKGHITLNTAVVQPFKKTLKEYLENTLKTEIPDDYVLSNGWMWQTTISGGDIYFDGVDISVYNRDYVLIHNRNESFTKLSDVAKSTVDIVRGIDNNVVTHDELLISCTQIVEGTEGALTTLEGKAGLSVYNAQTNLSNEVKNNFVLTSDNDTLSTLVGTKSNVYLTTDSDSKWLSTLTINKISLEKYKDLEAHGQIKDDQLYFVDEGQLNAYNQAILSVATPLDSNISSSYCAANRKYVDDSITNSAAQTYSTTIKTKTVDLSSKIYTMFKTGEYELDDVRDAMLSLLTILANV